MNPPDSNPDDPALRALLRGAHPAPALPPRFQEGVWQRLQRAERKAEAASSPGWLEQFVRRVLRPAYATVGLAAVMLAGTWFGIRAGDGQADRTERTRYVAAVSPFQRTAP
ncbi:MAG TPA: hypothetical protein VMB21_08140 [Candidatus Limnocylindria bacterium]|jgi:hypothetical protein|nr:hypothetical protein [Candidatus Limnocylindria bacterium]